MSFQITAREVFLAGHPDGRASPCPTSSAAVGILISSGTDWTDRTETFGRAELLGLDIFSQALVLRDTDGWQRLPMCRPHLARFGLRREYPRPPRANMHGKWSWSPHCRHSSRCGGFARTGVRGPA